MAKKPDPTHRPPYFPYDSYEERLLAQFESYFSQLARVRLSQRLHLSSPELNGEQDRLHVARREFGKEIRAYLRDIGLLTDED